MTNLKCFVLLLVTLIRFSDAKPECDCQPNVDDRIVGGTRTGKHEIPWQLSLATRRNNKMFHICGATLLNSNWAVTASHCVYGYTDESDYLLGMGTNDLEEMTESKRIPAKRIITHRQYNPRTPSSKGDIALIELSRPVNLTQFIKPACLVKNLGQLDNVLKNDRDTVLTASGFGSVTRTYKFVVGNLRGGKIERYMKKADFRAVQENERNNDCRHRNDLICIKPLTKGDSVCNGDSGGPLQAVIPTGSADSSNANKMSVIGVTSFGSGDISRPLPLYVSFCNGNAAYTKIPYYNQFITSNIKEDDLCWL